MSVSYHATCSCSKAECKGVALTAKDAERAIDWFNKSLGAEHAEHTKVMTIDSPDAVIAERDALHAQIAHLVKWRDEIQAERDAARTELAAIRTAMGAWPDSDLVSLATTMKAQSAERDTARSARALWHNKYDDLRTEIDAQLFVAANDLNAAREELTEAHEFLDDVLGETGNRPEAPVVDRIVVLVSVLNRHGSGPIPGEVL